LIKSTDSGATWTDLYTRYLDTRFPIINGCGEVHAIVLDRRTDPNTVYVSSFEPYEEVPGLAKSSDGGQTWTTLGSPLLATLAIDPSNSNVLYGGTVNWNSFSDGLDDLNVQSLTFGSTTTLLAATNTGVYRTYDDVPLLSMDSARYCIGDPWKLTLANAAATAVIRLIGSSNGASWEISEWRKTDLYGRLTESGVFSASTSRNHTVQLEVSGARSNRLSFVVSNCLP
jgi:hypothetical protein